MQELVSPIHIFMMIMMNKTADQIANTPADNAVYVISNTVDMIAKRKTLCLAFRITVNSDLWCLCFLLVDNLFCSIIPLMIIICQMTIKVGILILFELKPQDYPYLDPNPSSEAQFCYMYLGIGISCRFILERQARNYLQQRVDILLCFYDVTSAIRHL